MISASENRWNIQTTSGEVIWYAFMAEWGPETDVTFSVDLEIGETYRLVVYDSYGDGLCKYHMPSLLVVASRTP